MVEMTSLLTLLALPLTTTAIRGDRTLIELSGPATSSAGSSGDMQAVYHGRTHAGSDASRALDGLRSRASLVSRGQMVYCAAYAFRGREPDPCRGGQRWRWCRGFSTGEVRAFRRACGRRRRTWWQR